MELNPPSTGSPLCFTSYPQAVIIKFQQHKFGTVYYSHQQLTPSHIYTHLFPEVTYNVDMVTLMLPSLSVNRDAFFFSLLCDDGLFQAPVSSLRQADSSKIITHLPSILFCFQWLYCKHLHCLRYILSGLQTGLGMDCFHPLPPKSKACPGQALEPCQTQFFFNYYSYGGIEVLK